MRRRGRRPAARRPAVYLDDIVILRQAQSLRGLLRGLGVRAVDLDDLVQEVAFGAWCSMYAGRFRPNPRRPLRGALRAWLEAIARHLAGHYQSKAHRRWERLRADPARALRRDEDRLTPQLLARDALQKLRRLPRWARDVLAEAAVGQSVEETAAELGRKVGTVEWQRWAARARYAALLRGRKRRTGGP